jgi:hypothetical protein
MAEYIYYPKDDEIYSPTVRGEHFITHSPSVDQVLEELDPLPAYSLMLGMCEDDLPLVLDLNNPGSGSFLIAGENEGSNTNLLHSILTSAYSVNTEEQLNIHLLSPYADDLVELHKLPHLKISFDPGRPECEIMIEELVNLVHQRRSRQKDPIHLLAIDSLDLLLHSLSPEAYMKFNWLVEFGPKAGVWVFATIDTNDIRKSHMGLLEGFKSRILGNIQFQRIARYLSGTTDPVLEELMPGMEAIVRSGDDLIRIWIPHAEDIDIGVSDF